jgi:hypothetical protein
VQIVGAAFLVLAGKRMDRRMKKKGKKAGKIP